MTQRTVTLLLADIKRSLPLDGEWPTLPALQRLLSKGRHERLVTDFFATLFESLPIPFDSSGDPPVAPLSAYGEGLAASAGWWLRVDPVHMVADRDQLYLSASSVLEVSEREVSTLMTELNSLYGEEGWQFVAATPRRWYLRLPQPLTMRTTPTSAAVGNRVGEVLPQGEDALYWQRVMTEIQMVLHVSPVNEWRRQEGMLEVNSLWFWGGGELPTAGGRSDYTRVITDDPLAKGLARLHGLPVERTDAFSIDEVESENILWLGTVESAELLEQTLFAPLLAMIQAGKLDELMIMLPGLGRWRVDRAALRRWWRRTRPLATLLDEA